MAGILGRKILWRARTRGKHIVCFRVMRLWLIIWAAAGVLLGGSAFVFSPDTDFPLVAMLFPWAALWASLVAHTPLPPELDKVPHVTIGALLVLVMTVCGGWVAQVVGLLGETSLKILALAALAGCLFGLVGTGWAVIGSCAWKRRRIREVAALHDSGRAEPQP